MSSSRNAMLRGEPPLTARSVVASLLLGNRPPALPVAVLVRACALFGIAEGTTRTALSRMVATGELEADAGRYALRGRLLERQARQEVSRAPRLRAFDGTWSMRVVTASGRPAAERSELRAALAQLRLAEWRDGVWLRPDNLPDDAQPPGAARLIRDRCAAVAARIADTDDAALAASLWDLDGWAARAGRLRAAMAPVTRDLEAGDTAALAPGFVLSAAVLRHFQADPLLPEALLPAAWPGDELRADYARYDAAFRALWRTWLRAAPRS